MTLRKRQLSTYSRYNVEVSTTKIEDSSLLRGKSKKSLAYSVAKKFSALVTLAMLVVVTFSGLLTTAPNAKAWGVDDIMNDAHNAFCTSAPLGYKTEDRGALAPKYPKNRDNITAYEKYGMSATQFTTWSGFNPDAGKGGGMDENKNNGAGSTRGIVNSIGGDAEDAKLTEWQKSFKDKESSYPGMFNFSGECGGLSFRSMGSQGANIIFMVSKSVTWVAGFSYEAAADINSTIFKTMEKPVNKIVKTLKDKLYFAYLTPIIMIGALWMAYIGMVKRQATQVLSGVIWMIGAVAASVALMTNPMALPKLVNDTVGGISANTMGVITSSAGSGGKGELCYAPPQTKESKSTNSVRAVQCNLWYSFVYTPFSIGQFGEAPKKLTQVQDKTGDNSIKKLRNSSSIFKRGDTTFNALKSVGGGGDTRFSTVKVGNRNITESEQNFALAWIDFKSNWNDDPKQRYNKVRSMLNITMNQLGPEKYNADFRGDNVGNRVTMALVALVSAIASGAMIIVISVALIILDLGLIILALVFPLFALAALHPGEGRKIAMGWVELLCKIALRRVVGSIYLATLILVFSVLVSAELAWAMSMILMIAIAAAGLVYYKKIDGAFSAFSLGGKPFEMPGAQAGQKASSAAWNNAKAFATGGRAGHNSLTGRALNEKRQNKVWEKRVGGAGSAPQPKDTTDTTNQNTGGAGATPTRKSIKEAQKKEARERTLQGRLNDPQGELDENQNPMLGGAGEEPQDREYELDENNQIPQAEIQSREYDEEFEHNQAGAGEEPQDREYELDENNQIPTPQLPQSEKQEQGQEQVGAGTQPQSYQEQLKSHQGYAGSRIASKDAKIEQRKQKAIDLGNKANAKAIDLGNKANAKIAPIARNVTQDAKAVIGEKVNTGKFYAANSVRELRDNLKNGVQSQVRVAKGKMGEVSEAQRQKRIDKHHQLMSNSPVFKGRGFSRNESASIIDKQIAEAKARRERISSPIKAVGGAVGGAVGAKSAQLANAGSNIARAGSNIARVRASQGMEATRQQLSKVADTAKAKTVVAYQENRAMKKIDKLNLSDIKQEQKLDRAEYRQARKEMKQDISSQPRSIRDAYAERKYGADRRGNAVTSQASNAAKSYVPPAVRAQEARVQERQLQEKQAQKEQKRQPAPPVSSAPRQSAPPVSSAPRQPASPVADKPRQSAPPVADKPRQSAPPVADKPRQSSSQVSSAPRQSSPQVSSTPRQSAPPVADKPRQSAPPVADKPRQSAPRQSAPPVADKPRQSAPRQSAPPVADKPRQSAPPVADKPKQSAPQVSSTPRQSAPPVADKPRQSAPRQSAPPVADKPRQSAPQVSSTPRQSAPPVADKSKKSAPPVADKPKQSAPPVASHVRPAKEQNSKIQGNPTNPSVRRSEPTTSAPKPPLRRDRNPINKKK